MTPEEQACQIVDSFFIGGGGDTLEQPNLTKHDLMLAIKHHIDEAVAKAVEEQAKEWRKAMDTAGIMARRMEREAVAAERETLIARVKSMQGAATCEAHGHALADLLTWLRARGEAPRSKE